MRGVQDTCAGTGLGAHGLNLESEHVFIVAH